MQTRSLLLINAIMTKLLSLFYEINVTFKVFTNGILQFFFNFNIFLICFLITFTFTRPSFSFENNKKRKKRKKKIKLIIYNRKFKTIFNEKIKNYYLYTISSFLSQKLFKTIYNPIPNNQNISKSKFTRLSHPISRAH